LNFYDLLLISIGLAMDAFAVSLTTGFVINKNFVGNAFKIGISFGFFQFIMPIIGWLACIRFRSYIENTDHWIAFGLLTFIGVKMLYDGLHSKKENNTLKNDLSYKTLLVLSIATSIDALAVGVSLATIDENIINAAVMIGITAFLLSIMGVFLGRKFGSLFKNKAEIAGGLILIIIGIKILVEHLFFPVN